MDCYPLTAVLLTAANPTVKVIYISPISHFSSTLDEERPGQHPVTLAGIR